MILNFSYLQFNGIGEEDNGECSPGDGINVHLDRSI